jgi:hypothetical protein
MPVGLEDEGIEDGGSSVRDAGAGIAHRDLDRLPSMLRVRIISGVTDRLAASLPWR